MTTINNAQKIHFIGIGGIGVSAIAKLMLLRGKKITGSDRANSTIIKGLKNKGAQIYIGHRQSNLSSDVDLIIYTTAIEAKNPEFIKARKLGLKAISYPEALGIISQDKYTIAIAGTHGKTTTTAMSGLIFVKAGLDPTIIVGTTVKQFNGNLRSGRSKYLVVEACEYRRAFLNLNPNILVITNIDADHLDYYKNLGGIIKAFKELVGKLEKQDILITDVDDKNIKKILPYCRGRIIDYKSKNLSFSLNVPGQHNVFNAQAASAVAGVLKINKKIIKEALLSFKGTGRRLEKKGKSKEAIVYDDYAHHPTEVKASLAALRSLYSNKKIICVFQPHLYSRTKSFFKEFTKSFYDASEIILTDVYAAREKKDKTVSMAKLAKEIKASRTCRYLKGFDEIIRYLDKNLDKNCVVVTMGAGDIWKVSEKLVKSKTRK